MRGARDLWLGDTISMRIIPADAGSTIFCRAISTLTKDHPRGCGEHAWLAHGFVDSLGSSPRMRGALFDAFHGREVDGIIPADAGSTRGEQVSVRLPQDHPRGCGEHRGRVHSRLLHGGSSPRMRGAPLRRAAKLVCGRIIPADAGSTPIGGRPPRRWRDHPRGCGEHTMASVRSSRFRGSSPRMRGALTASRGLALKVGIIPADAGSTRRQPCQIPVRKDHPRGCGEHTTKQETKHTVHGSSPRMRGARLPQGIGLQILGIIPADAGST